MRKSSVECNFQFKTGDDIVTCVLTRRGCERCFVLCPMQSCKGGRVQQVEELIFYGADINQQNTGGNTALHVCAASSQVCACQCICGNCLNVR